MFVEEKRTSDLSSLSVCPHGTSRLATGGFSWYCMFGTSAQCVNVGRCHHGMERPRVADGGTDSSMESGCQYVE